MREEEKRKTWVHNCNKNERTKHPSTLSQKHTMKLTCKTPFPCVPCAFQQQRQSLRLSQSSWKQIWPFLWFGGCWWVFVLVWKNNWVVQIFIILKFWNPATNFSDLGFFFHNFQILFKKQLSSYKVHLVLSTSLLLTYYSYIKNVRKRKRCVTMIVYVCCFCGCCDVNVIARCRWSFVTTQKKMKLFSFIFVCLCTIVSAHLDSWEYTTLSVW